MEDSESDESLSASEPEERRGVGMAGEITGVAATSSSSKGSVSPDVAIGDAGFGSTGDAGTVGGCDLLDL